MIWRFTILYIFLSCLYSPVYAQIDDDFNEVLQVPLFFSEVNPESPAGIFSLDLPFYFSGDNDLKEEFSFGYSMGNTWHPQASFVYPQNITQGQRAQVEPIPMYLRPQYFELAGIETQEKVFHSDGVLQHFRFAYLKNWRHQSLILNVNIHMLAGGSSPVNFLVSDGLIEAFHSSFGVEDNFGRRLFPFNRASIEFTDETGKSIRKDKGDVFLGVIDLHYYRSLFRVNSTKWQFDSQLSAHLSVPLNNLHSYVIPGISAGFRVDRLLGAKSSFTVALDGGVVDQTFLKMGDGLNFIDWKYRKQAKAYMGVNFISKKKNTTVIGILTNYQDPLMKGYYFTMDQMGYHEIGVQFLEEGDIWEGQPISQMFRLAKLTPASLYYFSLKSYLVLGFHKNGRKLNVYLGEDLISVNNAPDIQLGFQYSLPLLWHK